jgi:galactokinase
MNLEQQTIAAYQALFSSRYEHIVFAPGRVNIIGDHTDYNDGFVLPAAINFGTWVAGSKRNDNEFHIVAKDISDQVIVFNLGDIHFNEEHPWANYPMGCVKYLLASGFEIGGANLVISGNIPRGAGLSSSASLEIAVLKCLTQLFQLSLDGVKAALIGQQAENNFVGCNCGIMDQLISALGQKDSAMLLDCRSLAYQYADIPDDLAIVIIDSAVKRGLVDSEYNTRREQCNTAAKLCGKESLRDLSLNELISAETKLSATLYKRALHVVSESIRTESALKALQENDLATLSELMKRSHYSLKNNFAVTTPEIDYLVDIISTEVGEQGGVRMTGGGFGGCVVALVKKSLVPSVFSAVESKYYKRTKLTAKIFQCSALNGAFYDVAAADVTDTNARREA